MLSSLQKNIDKLPLDTIAALMLAAFFFGAGVMKIFAWDGYAASMARQNVPFIPLLLGFTTVIELVAGAGLAFRKYRSLSAVALALFLVPVTFMMHAFWTMPAETSGPEFAIFYRNLAVIAGLLALASLPQKQTT